MRLHFTPTYSSWLNQVELWFAKIERDVIARGPWLANSVVISTPTPPTLNRFVGNTQTSLVASVVTIWLRQATSNDRSN